MKTNRVKKSGKRVVRRAPRGMGAFRRYLREAYELARHEHKYCERTLLPTDAKAAFAQGEYAALIQVQQRFNQLFP